ncbi:DUF1707 domain-containing protein [Nocardia africana]|uniref:Domain of uncharacterized function (DUF1707) n=1 Tax=Nocardia africana TaxID=134964 RepID=A0A378X704_9NOCA|nr:DUF1707 domain-containing protein [Nocardia africana]MCC3317751.1 DUF1707 domain-containing protein [Nocardia africana]SUA48514.1 Domain of uncharacterised function (DUF1707) [Nocardia africana]
MGTFATSRNTGASPGSANSGLRVRDSDRVDACALLDAARDDGQLSVSEHGRRTAAAMRARTFADVEKVIGDLQIPANLVDAPVVRPARRRRAGRWVAAGGAVAAAALIGMFCGWVSSEDGPLADHAPPDMTTAAGIAAFLSDYRQHYGDLLADGVTLMPENASIERPRPGDRSTSERASYKGEFDTRTTSSRDPKLEPIDLGTIDVPKLAALLAGAPRTVGSPQTKVSHLIIGRDSSAPDHPPTVTIFTEGARSGHLVVAPSGEPLVVYKSQP